MTRTTDGDKFVSGGSGVATGRQQRGGEILVELGEGGKTKQTERDASVAT